MILITIIKKYDFVSYFFFFYKIIFFYLKNDKIRQKMFTNNKLFVNITNQRKKGFF